MRLNLFRACAVVGINITPTSLCLVQLKKIKQQYLVEQSAVIALHADVWQNGRETQWSSLADILASTVAKLKLQRKPAVAHLPSHLVRTGSLMLPEGLKSIEIENEIYTYALHDWRAVRENTIVKFKPLATMNGYHKIQYVCAEKQDISQYANIVRQAGLKIKIIEVDIYALQRFIYANSTTDFNRNQAHVIVFATANTAMMLVVESEQIVFHRKLSLQADITWVVPVKQLLKEFALHFPEVTLRQLILQGQGVDDQALLESLSSFTLIKPNYLSSFIFKSADSATVFNDQINCLAIAAGAAMRDIFKC